MSSQGHKPCIYPIQSTRLQWSCPVKATFSHSVQSTLLQGSCPVRATLPVSILYNRQGCKGRVQSGPHSLYLSFTIEKVARVVSSQGHTPCIHPIQSTILQESCPVRATRPVFILYNRQYCKGRIQSGPQALCPASTIDKVARVVSSQDHLQPFRTIGTFTTPSNLAATDTRLLHIAVGGSILICSAGTCYPTLCNLYQRFPKLFCSRTPFWPRKKNTYPHILADVNTDCPDDRYTKLEFYISELTSDSHQYIPVAHITHCMI